MGVLDPPVAGFARLASKAVPRLSSAMPVVLGSPPLVSYSASDAATTLTNPVAYPLGGGSIRLGGAQAFTSNGTDLAGNPYLGGSAQTGNEFPVCFFAFLTDAPAVEIIYQGNLGPQYRLWVNGQVMTLDGVTAGGATSGHQHRMLITFSGRQFREIRVDSNTFFASSVVVTGADTVIPAPRKRTIAFMGDSYTQNGGLNGLAPVASRLAGCDFVVNGSGGTGYNQDQAGSGGKEVFIDRLPGLLAASPDYLITLGGINDSTTNLQADVSAYLALAKEMLPAERIVVVGPWDPPNQNHTTIATKRNSIQAATVAAGCRFVDNITEEWQTGTGSVATPAGDGNNDVYNDDGGTHPNQAGYTYLGMRVGLAFRSLYGVPA